MIFIRFLCVLCVAISAASAAEIIAFGGAEATPPPNFAGPSRYKGAPFTIVITLNAAASTTTPPDVTGITVEGQINPTPATIGSVIQAGSATLTEVPGTNRIQWRYRATPLRDGPATLKILPAVFGAIADTTQAIILDTDPVIFLTQTVITTQATFTGTIVSGIDLISPEPMPLSKDFGKIVATNGKFSTLGTNPSIAGTSLTVVVDAFGIGTVTCSTQSGAVFDRWGNTNATVTNNANISGTASGGTAPTVTAIIGLSPVNLVYHDGQTIDIAVQFSRAVKFDNATGVGDPFMTLNSTGSAASGAIAIFNPVATAAGSPTQMIFTYTVASGNKVPLLDVASSSSFTLLSQSGIVGTSPAPDAIANTSLPSPGSSTSLSKNYLYSINVEAAKPDPNDISGGTGPDKCAVGGGLGMMLSLGGLMLFSFRRRR